MCLHNATRLTPTQEPHYLSPACDAGFPLLEEHLLPCPGTADTKVNKTDRVLIPKGLTFQGGEQTINGYWGQLQTVMLARNGTHGGRWAGG